MDSVNTYFKDVVEIENNKIGNLKHIYGTVRSIVEPVNTGRAVVLVNNRLVTLLNKTNETLKVGDGVIVHYWDNLANGYIVLRCGLPNLKQGLHIENAAILRDNIQSVYSVPSTVFNIDEKNHLTEKYGDKSNIIMVNGNPAIQIPLDTSAANLKTIAMGIDKKLFSNEISVKCRYCKGNFITHSYVYGDRTLSAGIYEMKYENNQLSYYIGIQMKEDYEWYFSHHVNNDGVYQAGNVRFISTTPLKDIGVIIAYHTITETVSDRFPYGFVRGYPLVRCGFHNEGLNGNTPNDLIFAMGNDSNTSDSTMWFGFNSNAEREYAKAAFRKSTLKITR